MKQTKLALDLPVDLSAINPIVEQEEEDIPKVLRTTIRIPIEQAVKIDFERSKVGFSLNAWILKAIEEKLKEGSPVSMEEELKKLRMEVDELKKIVLKQ